jgi:branched-chain amino acid transport system substrate-binding protein
MLAFVALPAGLRADTPTPITIPVILSVTGNGAFAAKGDLASLQLVEAMVNKTGGIGPDHRPLKFAVVDDTSSPQVVVQFQNQILASKAPLMIGPSLTQQCNAALPLVRDNGPTQYCLSPAVNAPSGGFIFSSSVSLRDDVAVAIRYLRLRGLTRLAILSSTDATGQEADRAYAFVKSLPENKSIEFVAQEHFNMADGTVTAQMARIKAANPQAILTWTVGTAFFNELRGISDVGLDVPVLGCNCNMVPALLDAQKATMPKDLVFTASLPFAYNSLADGPVKQQQTLYFNAFKAIGVKPDFTTTLGWDPALIVVDALKHLGPNATAQQYREYINGLHGFAGINGVYDFRDGTQHGLSQNGVVMVRWDPTRSDFEVVSKRSGLLK